MTTMKYAAYIKGAAPLRFLRCLGMAMICVIMLAGCDGVHLPAGTPWVSPRDAKTHNNTAMPAAGEATGVPIYCTVGHGAARFEKGWVDFEDAHFTLRDGERVNITLKSKRGGHSAAFQGVFDKAGQKMLFCPVRRGAPNDRILCGSLYALEDDLQFGIKRTFDVPDGIMGATISCASDRKRLMPL